MIYILIHDDYFEQKKKSYFKIGFTKRIISKRIAELQVGNPRPLHLYLLDETGSLSEEKKLKNILKKYKSSGGKEWFHFNENTNYILNEWISKKRPLIF